MRAVANVTMVLGNQVPLWARPSTKGLRGKSRPSPRPAARQIRIRTAGCATSLRGGQVLGGKSARSLALDRDTPPFALVRPVVPHGSVHDAAVVPEGNVVS